MTEHVEYLIERFFLDTGIDYYEQGILLCRAGSRAYNTFTDGSDYDYFGIVVPPAHRLLGFTGFDSWEPKKGILDHGLDCKIYSVKKAIELLLKGNPNMLEVLWFPEQVYEHISDEGRKLLSNRELFASKKSYHSLARYAKAQFDRMLVGTKDIKTQYSEAVAIIEAAGWTLSNVVEKKPLPMPDINSVMRYLFPDEATVEGERAARLVMIETRGASKTIRSIHARHFQAYMGERRKQNVLTYGYDPHNASHLIRLLYLGEGLAKTGRLDPWMTGDRRDVVLEIKRGEWELDRLKEYATGLWTRAEEAFASTALPDEPDTASAEILLLELQMRSIQSY
jgi:hypothetical protein